MALDYEEKARRLGYRNYREWAEDPKVSEMTVTFLKQIQKNLKERGFDYKNTKQSAMCEAHFKMGNKSISVSYWHGTGKGNRNYGSGKRILSISLWTGMSFSDMTTIFEEYFISRDDYHSIITSCIAQLTDFADS